MNKRLTLLIACFLIAIVCLGSAPLRAADEQIVAAPAVPAAPAEPPTPPVVESPPETVTADASTDKDQDEEAAEAEEPVVVKSKPRHYSFEKNWSYHAPRGSKVLFLQDNEVAAGKNVKGDVVAILGDTRVDGEVDRDAVAVLGDVYINGTVHRHAVAVLGNVHLGPTAHVHGDVVTVGGEVIKEPGAVVDGEIRHEEGIEEFAALRSWWENALRFGRPLAVAAHLSWLWIVTAFSVAFYALLGLIFPRAIRNCGDKLVLQPGLTILAAVLSVLALPVLFILLCITVVGIPVALLVLPVLLLLATLVGKASIYGLIGRKISGDRMHMALAVLIGAGIFILLYLVPVLGALLSLLVSLVGFGCVVLSLFADRNPPVIAAASPAAFAANVQPPIRLSSLSENPAMVAPLPPVISAMTLSRAGFWLRLAASILDAILVGMICGLLSAIWHNFASAYLFWYAAYCVVMWATKGTTIGGIICGLKVVRLDDRPIDWGVAIVRALGGFLSLAVAGLGFVWVAFDDEKQSWHDKIAGTTIVKVPKGTALL